MAALVPTQGRNLILPHGEACIALAQMQKSINLFDRHNTNAQNVLSAGRADSGRESACSIADGDGSGYHSTYADPMRTDSKRPFGVGQTMSKTTTESRNPGLPDSIETEHLMLEQGESDG